MSSSAVMVSGQGMGWREEPLQLLPSLPSLFPNLVFLGGPFEENLAISQPLSAFTKVLGEVRWLLQWGVGHQGALFMYVSQV